MEGVRLEAIVRKAELLSGGPLPEDAPALAEMAARQAMTLGSRDDVPEDMEQAVAALLLGLVSGRDRGTAREESGSAGDPAALRAVKSIQRGDTTIVYASGGSEAGLSAGTAAGSGTGAAGPDWSPWRRLGRLRHD